ncbi:MAG: enoyl-CoA hydratase-related protein, partial [Burkholderiaceae bacterium]
PRIVGLQRAKDLVFSAREVAADEALQLGILFRIVESGQLLDEALALAARYHGASTEALGIAKNILNRSFNLDQDTLAELESSAQAMALHTAYHDEAVASFLAKRPLSFKGVPKP